MYDDHDSALLDEEFGLIIESAGYDVQGYSGRGMLGKHCLGVVCDSPIKMVLDAIKECAVHHPECVLQMIEKLQRFRQDSFGKREIVYWPSIEFPQEEE